MSITVSSAMSACPTIPLAPVMATVCIGFTTFDFSYASRQGQGRC